MSLYHEASTIISESLSDGGGSLKSQVFNRKGLKSPPNQLFALVFETYKWSAILKEVIERSELLKYERKLTPILALLLVHDLLVAKNGIALPQSHGLRACVERQKSRLSSELTLARLRRKQASLAELREQVELEAAGEEVKHPRWVRVNALKTDVEEQLETTFSGYTRALALSDLVTKSGKQVFIDPNVPDLLGLTAGTDVTKTEAYLSGKIILQDKASCFPSYLLDPRAEDGDVIDACAAPGNKTTHLAAILHQHKPEYAAPPQAIFAFEKNTRRARTLEKMVGVASARKVTRIGLGQDFLQVDPHSEKYARVGALLLDPSCSGSGIIGRDSTPTLHLPTLPGLAAPKGAPTGEQMNSKKRKLADVEDDAQETMVNDDGDEVVMKTKLFEQRLEALADFQLRIVLHAFEFPAATKVTYSTCSVYAQENERVVKRALDSDVARRQGWRILRRNDQVVGMREWPLRGLPEESGGDKTLAESCIRANKGDGRGVMGFFVAAFVRDAAGGGDQRPAAEADIFLRDDDGRVLRDVLGMPFLKSTGEAVALEESDEDEMVAAEGSSKEHGAMLSSQQEQSASEAESSSYDSGSDDDDGDDGGWGGIAD